jgi:hypothetical protein
MAPSPILLETSTPSNPAALAAKSLEVEWIKRFPAIVFAGAVLTAVLVFPVTTMIVFYNNPSTLSPLFNTKTKCVGEIISILSSNALNVLLLVRF